MGRSDPRFAARNATLASPGATSTNWSLSVSVPDGSYLMSVGATDGAGNVDATSATRNFSVNTAPPDTTPADGTITFPTNNQVLNDATPTITGGATDNVGVGQVQVSIRNITTGQYMKADGTFQVAFVAVTATVASPGATSTTWQYTPPVNLTNDQYRVEVRAKDTSNNLDPTRQNLRFVIAVLIVASRRAPLVQRRGARRAGDPMGRIASAGFHRFRPRCGRRGRGDRSRALAGAHRS